MALDVPLIPVHHIRGHIAANYLAFPELEPPFLCLVVSGGHSLIVDVRGYTELKVLGTTRDDAAGECFDKVARVLGMPYPGGAALDQMAQAGVEGRYALPVAHVSGNDLDMSFSGLKTAALNLIHHASQKGEVLDVPGPVSYTHLDVYKRQMSAAVPAAARSFCGLWTPKSASGILCWISNSRICSLRPDLQGR